MSLGLDAEVELGDDDVVVCSALGTTHSPCDPHVLPVPLPDDDIINKISMLRARVHP